MSTAYYAMFDALARMCADEIAGASRQRRASPQWVRVHRALNHGRPEAVLGELDPERKRKLRRGEATGIGAEIEDFCELLEILRLQRLHADYDPSGPSFDKRDVLRAID